MKLVLTVVFSVGFLLRPRLLLHEAYILELTALGSKKAKQNISKAYLTGKRAKLFHRGYVMLVGSTEPF